MRCLVVDDSSVIREVARRLLEELRFEVIEAEHGGQALEMCRAKMPDLILLDRSMPVMNGYEFLLQLRPLVQHHKPLIIYCTIENDHPEAVLARAAGADEILLKPFDRQSLAASVAAARHAKRSGLQPAP